MKLLKFIGQNAVINFITYALMGLLAANILGYREIWAETMENYGYRAFDSTWVMLGPILQPLRGAVYGLILWPFRDTILKSRFGWLKLFGLFWGIGIFGTFAAGIGSFEGFIYTDHKPIMHLWGQPEIIGHALLYSFLLVKLADEKTNNVKTGIKALSVAFLSKVVYILFGLVVAGITGTSTSTESINPVIYIALIISTVVLSVLIFILLKRQYSKLKMFLIYLLGVSIPYIVLSFIQGINITGLLSLIISSSLAALISMLLTFKLR